MDVLVSDHRDSGRSATVLICSYREQDSVITSSVFDFKQDAEVPLQLIQTTITYITRNTSLENSRFFLTRA